MLFYPNCKINIGLNVTFKRADGYHNIETIFYPIKGLTDRLEIKLNHSGSVNFVESGLTVDATKEDNLIVRTYRLFEKKYGISGVDIYFEKSIPFGAGLGGGSSDAAHTAIALNELFHLHLSCKQLQTDIKQLGADCPFFILNRPCFAQGIGDVFTPIDLMMNNKAIVLVKPQVSVNTKTAYQGITVSQPECSLIDLVQKPISTWKDTIKNDFENTVFPKFPSISSVKNRLYQLGAQYASMSGSGATVFGIFTAENLPSADQLKANFNDCFVHIEKIF